MFVNKINKWSFLRKILLEMIGRTGMLHNKINANRGNTVNVYLYTLNTIVQCNILTKRQMGNIRNGAKWQKERR